MTLPVAGALAFGLVIGWFTYFINRYRKGEVQLADLTTLLGVVGGAAVTTLFGDAKGPLFGAYGLGLAMGFFAYFLVLVVLVALSKGQFDSNYFLDGRRQLPKGEWHIPDYVRPGVTPMGAGRGRPSGASTAVHPRRTPVSDTAARLRDKAISAGELARGELAALIANEPDAPRRKQLTDLAADLDRKVLDLRAESARELNDIGEAAIAALAGVTADLEREAKVMKSAADRLTAVASVISHVSRIIGIFSGLAV